MTDRSAEEARKASSSPECGVAVRKIIRRSGFRARQKIEALLLALVRAHTGMRLIDDDEVRAARAKPSRRFSALM
jgi:hypothetical protein